MEINPQTLRSVWWKGAFSNALRGIPQGLMLGAAGALLLFGLCAALPVSWGLATSMGGFLFSDAAAGVTLANLNFIPMLALNTVLTTVGNFINGGTIACNAYKQDVEHNMNDARISQIEARERAVEACITPQSRHVAQIVANGPRAQHSFAEAETTRTTQPTEPTRH